MSVHITMHKSGSKRTLDYRITDCRSQNCGLNIALIQENDNRGVIGEVALMGVTREDCEVLIEAGIMAKRQLREGEPS